MGLDLVTEGKKIVVNTWKTRCVYLASCPVKVFPFLWECKKNKKNKIIITVMNIITLSLCVIYYLQNDNNDQNMIQSNRNIQIKTQ